MNDPGAIKKPDLQKDQLPRLSKVVTIPTSASSVLKQLRQAGYSTYIVGGWVRDALLLHQNNGVNKYQKLSINHLQKNDIDFTTQAHPKTVIELFPNTIPTGIKHGTITVRMEDQCYEVTTFRKEGKYHDHRHPEDVAYAKTLDEDLFRRDFTINAFAYDPVNDELIDRFNGRVDLSNATIRVITTGKEPHENRFKEDALRMMRACRFASQLGFTIESKTLKAIENCASLIKNISPERIRDELIKLVIGSSAPAGLEYLRTTGLMKWVLPELLQAYGVSQNTFHAYDVYEHSLRVLENLNTLQYTERGEVSYTLSLAGLFHDIGKPDTKNVHPEKIINDVPQVTFYRHELVGEKKCNTIMRRLKFSNKDIHRVTHMVRHHMFHYTPEWRDGTVRRFVAKIGFEVLPDLFLLRKADRLGKGSVPKEHLDTYFEENHDLDELLTRVQTLSTHAMYLTIKDLKVNGEEIMSALNITPGKTLGNILQELLERVLDTPELNERETLLKLAQEIYLDMR